VTIGENSNRVKTLFLFLFLFSLVLKAEVETYTSTDAIAKDAHLANINALLIFTSQDGLNTGLFHFTKANIDMQIYNLPFRYHFDSDSKLNYFLMGNVGYSRVSTSKDFVLPPNSRLTADTHLQTYTAGLGLGVRYKLLDDLSVMSGIELIYSRSGVSVKESDESITAPIEDFFNQNYNDNLSYKILLEAEYRPEVKYMRPYFKMGYKFYDTKSDFSFEKLASFTSQSSVLSTSIGVETDPLFPYKNGYFTLEGYLNGNYMQGDVVKSVGFNAYSKVGAVGYWYLDNGPSWIKRFFTEVSTINADGLAGYNIGIGFTVKY